MGQTGYNTGQSKTNNTFEYSESTQERPDGKGMTKNINIKIDLVHIFLLYICTIDYIDQLIEAGVRSFKIEGRMKRPEYVYSAVKMYRKAVDHYLRKHEVAYNQEELETLQGLFQRGYSKGYAFHEKQIAQIKDKFIDKFIHISERKRQKLRNDMNKELDTVYSMQDLYEQKELESISLIKEVLTMARALNYSNSIISHFKNEINELNDKKYTYSKFTKEKKFNIKNLSI